jgi:FAD/FMN-containing dehydrogenase
VSGRRNRRLIKAVIVILAAMSVVVVWSVIRAPIERQTSPFLINDVTQLNPIAVSMVLTPKTTEEIVVAVKQHGGPISVGGARHSMGGQIAAPGGLHIDMRQFDRILSFSPAEKTITVQAGTRWRQIQERIDEANLSIAIMQTYANFTVGGSLSVNVHGRYVGRGPIIQSVRSLKVILADGVLVEASPGQNADIFNAVIGGYGGLGVITEATLDLTANVRVKREDLTMPIAQYRQYFTDHIRGSPAAVFHNGDIYPDAYDTVHAVTYSKTDAPATVADRLLPLGESHRLDRFVYWVVSTWPFGKVVRQHIVDPILFRSEPVTWRNYEASYDATELEPASRSSSTYVLEEYFVPVDRFDNFVPRCDRSSSATT